MSVRVSRPPRERLAAWLVTGPPGHLWSVIADVVVLWARYLVSRLRSRSKLKP